MDNCREIHKVNYYWPIFQINISFFLVVCIFITFLSGTANSANISNNYNLEGLYWLLNNKKEANISLPYELDSGDLPIEIKYQSVNMDFETVIRNIKFIYPDGTPLEKQSYSVEVWISSEKKPEKYKMAYRSKSDESEQASVINIVPTLARYIKFRFYESNHSGTTMLPMIEFEGDASPAKTKTDNLKSVEYNYIVFLHDYPIGELRLSREKIDGGLKYIYDYYAGREYIFPFQSGVKKINEKMHCEITADATLNIDKLDCDYPEDKLSVKGRLNRTFELDPNKTFDKDEEYETETEKTDVTLKEMISDKMAADGLAVGAERTYHLVFPDVGKFIDVSATVLDYYPERKGRPELYAIWVSDENYDYVNSVELIESNGAILRAYDYLTSYEYWLVEDPTEWDIKPYLYDYEKILGEIREKLKNIIGLPDDVKKARVHIRWNEVPPSMLDLEGPRQRLISVTETEPGVYDAEIETKRRLPGDAAIADQKSISDAELESYLLPDEIVETENPAVIKMAKEIVGDEKDPLEISIKIFNWLIRHIGPDVRQTFDVPRAYKIMSMRAGDCKHFAVLFATMARISGIPTRFVFGQRYIGGDYGYHVWNQIYVDGGWLDVDASDPNFFPGSLHVQLDTGITFSEKQYIGVLLGFRPDPEPKILETGPADFRVIDGSRNTILTDSFYQDALLRFRVNFPPEFEHKIIDLGLSRKIILSLTEDPRFFANIYIFPKKIGDYEQDQFFLPIIDILSSVHLMDLYGAIKKADTEKIGRTTIAGKKAYYVTGAFMDNKNSFIHFDLNTAELYGCNVVFYFAAPTDTFNKYYDTIDMIKKSFITY